MGRKKREKVCFTVFGDVHGRQEEMYAKARAWEIQEEKRFDAILQCGDFETMRTPDDFSHYYAPKRFHRTSDIAAYMDGLKRAELLTIFIGGNHEAWGVLSQNNDGGFVCPNVYYLGRAGTLM